MARVKFGFSPSLLLSFSFFFFFLSFSPRGSFVNLAMLGGAVKLGSGAEGQTYYLALDPLKLRTRFSEGFAFFLVEREKPRFDEDRIHGLVMYI